MSLRPIRHNVPFTVLVRYSHLVKRGKNDEDVQFLALGIAMIIADLGLKLCRFVIPASLNAFKMTKMCNFSRKEHNTTYVTGAQIVQIRYSRPFKRI